MKTVNSTIFRLLESINAQAYELALVVPVLLGIKPASTITLTDKDEDTYVVDEKLQRMGLFTDIVIRDDSPRFHTIHVAKTSKNLKQLTETSFNNNYNLGLAYGYPKTAVDAAKSGDLISERALPGDKFIITFSMSKNNWQEEYKVMQKWNKAVEKYTPKLYKRFLELDIK